MATVSCIAVLSLANLCGAVVKGITGFGSAIINIFVWGLAAAAGLDAGSLQQAVVSECVSSMVLALPLLYATRVWSTCDWRLTLSLLLCTATAAPGGALLLKYLAPRVVEAVMAVILLLVICLHCRVAARMQQWLLNRVEQGHTSAELQLLVCAPPPATCDAGASRSSTSCGSRQEPGSAAADSGAEASAGLAWHGCSDGNSMLPLLCEDRAGSKSSSSSRSSDASRVPQRDVLVDTVGSCEEQQHLLLLVPDASTHSDCVGCSIVEPHSKDSTQQWRTNQQRQQQQAVDSAHKDVCRQQTSSGISGAASSCTQAAADRGSWLFVLWGACAGCASGLMGGLTGMGGPPLMVLYDKLSVQKETVRGCNAVLNVLQFRVIAYWLASLFKREDACLYTAVAVAGLVGMCCGHHLASRMSQQTFSKVMLALMVLCCALLFASAAGVLGQH